jgi:hypothetical protein
MTTYAAFIEENRMKLADPTKLDRKSGGSGGICGFKSVPGSPLVAGEKCRINPFHPRGSATPWATSRKAAQAMTIRLITAQKAV